MLTLLTRGALCRFVACVAVAGCAGPQGAAHLDADAAAVADVGDSDADSSVGAAPAAPEALDGGGPDDGLGTEAGATLEPLPDLPDPSARGPWPVGTVTLDLHDSARDREVPTRIWYPAAPSGDEVPAEYLLGLLLSDALVDAPVADGAPRPLVLFSHGFNGVKEQSFSFTEHLASHGFVVVAMDHLGNTLFDANASDEVVAQVALERPRDVLYVHDTLAQDGGATWPVTAAIDFDRVAITGHSFGAFTALIVAGADSDPSAALAACEAGDPSDIFCPYIVHWPPDAIIAVAPPPGLRAAVSLAPAGASAFGAHGLDGVSVPTLLFGGSRDETAPMDIEIRPIYDRLPSPRALAEITDATHFGFTDVCTIGGMDEALPDLCGDPQALAHTEVFRLTNAVTVAWLWWTLLDDPRALELLESPLDDLLELTTDGVLPVR